MKKDNLDRNKENIGIALNEWIIERINESSFLFSVEKSSKSHTVRELL